MKSNKKHHFKYLLLLFLSLACSLTDSSSVDRADVISSQAQPTARIGDEMIMPTSTLASCTVLAAVLQVRECAGVSCRVKDWLDHGVMLTVLKNENGWIQVITPTGENGWVNSKYCGGME
jgi:uncharacterized protein YgiM (DUF1202 family)